MADGVHCACGRLLDAAATCRVCGRRPSRRGLRAVLAAAGGSFLAVVMVGGLTVSLLGRTSPSVPVPPPVEVAAATQPVEEPPAVPVIEPPTPEPPPIPDPPPAPKPPPAEPPPAPPGRTGKLEATVPPPGGYAVGEAIPQEVVVTRRSTFRVLGVVLSQGVQYALASRLVVTAVKPDGSLTVEQTVTTARLLDADPDARTEFAAALEAVPGTKFELTVGPTGGVTAVTGLKTPTRVTGGKLADFQTLRVSAVLDADAWKELAGLTFFQPDAERTAGAKWSRPFAHDWGPLGGWSGQTNYVARGKPTPKSPLERIDYAHALAYKPTAGGAVADGERPIRVSKADFKATAGGALLYDPARRRVTVAEETFYARGGIVASVVGPEVPVEVEERQAFKLVLPDPTAGTLVGKPPKR